MHTTKWFKDPDCSYFVKQSSFWQPDIRQEALQPGSKKKKIKQDHLRRNVAPDQTIILVLQIFLDHRSLSPIDHKILMEGIPGVLDILLELAPYRKAGSYWVREVSQSVIGGL